VTTFLHRFRAAASSLVIATLAGCHAAPATQAPRSAATASVAWQQGDVDQALTEAKKTGTPILLYWGASWCAPCNKLKATLFRDPAFVELTQHLIPVYLDGDTRGAQVTGERFHLKGYPTLLLLRADGTELSRPNTLNAPDAILATLRSASVAATPSGGLMDRALDHPSEISQAEWRRLAEESWAFRVLSGEAGIGDKLSRLAANAPDPALRRRFGITSMIQLAAPTDNTHFTSVTLSQKQVRAIEDILRSTASTPDLVAQDRVLAYFESRLVAALPPSAGKRALAAQLQHAAAALRADTRVPLPDRIDTLEIDIALARNNGPAIPAAVVTMARTFSQSALASTTDPALLQSVLHEAALVRRDAGDIEGVHQMLLATLPRLTDRTDAYERLSENAEMRGKPTEAVTWIAREYEGEHGPASRLRFAVDYSDTAIRLLPDDKASVVRGAEAVITSFGGDTGDASSRTAAMVRTWSSRLIRWNAAHGDAALLGHLSKNLQAVCARQHAIQPSCSAWLPGKSNGERPL
jgi:protein disulfide-isomerase